MTAMIDYPENWQGIGKKISSSEISSAICSSIKQTGVHSLSLSGGIDSTLLLYFMKKVLGNSIYCYNVSLSEDHPDHVYAKMATDFFGVDLYSYFLDGNEEPDEVVKTFYTYLKNAGVKKIIAGDGIDEFSCGYYSHQNDPSERNYISWIRQLNQGQLAPLNKNSGSVSVYLPYLAPSVVALLSLIPIYDKVDSDCRKKIIVEMAKGNIPDDIINRRKFGFCDAASRKDLE